MKETLKECFEKNVQPGPGCWMWAGRLDRYGYGILGHGGLRHKAHRTSYTLYVGPIPTFKKGEKSCVLHRCDTPGCVNPAHLFLGTQGENMADKAAKGRAIGAHSGDRHHNAKLNADRVKEIRAAPERRAEWIEKFGIDRRTIDDVVQRKTWRHIQ